MDCKPAMLRSRRKGRPMKLALSVAIMAYLGFSTLCWAEGALAVGCASDGHLSWGFQGGETSTQVAQHQALQQCESAGGVHSTCDLLRQTLVGDGAWVALAMEPNPPPMPGCSPFGWYYSTSKAKAEHMAIAACQKNGGHNCTVAFVAQNKGTTTYTVVPHGSTRSPSGRCWSFQREVWGPYGFVTCQ
jgi:hypothetical protein